MSKCTCCALHGQGAHRDQPAAPASIETPELRQANTDLAAVAGAETRAREAWSEAAGAARAYEAGLYGRYQSTMLGIEQATPAEREELARLQQAAAGLLEKFQAAGQRTVEARMRAAAAQHKATQHAINAWAGVGA